uniref:SRCR domain-containing protein n=1 Tax=Sparus aurata TaxID=8175 RepID=A0A671TTQ9_SPAAU
MEKWRLQCGPKSSSVEAMSLLSWTVEPQAQIETPAHLAKSKHTCIGKEEAVLNCRSYSAINGENSRKFSNYQLLFVENVPEPEYRSNTLSVCCRLSSDSVRLVNGNSLCSGRLEVKSNQRWSSVCEDDFDQQDAEVVCRELGCGAPSVLQGALYGEVEAPMWTKEFQCGGHESALLDCRTLGSDRNTCSPGKAVGLTCSEPSDIRLVGGSSSCVGRFEMKYKGNWKPVSLSFFSMWDMMSAAVVCRQMDCGSALSIETIHVDKIDAWDITTSCGQSESAIRECVSISTFPTQDILKITCSGKNQQRQ